MNQAKFIEKYKDVQVEFVSYFKYTFTFVGDLSDGSKIYVHVGGDPDEIYGFPVSADGEEYIGDMVPYAGYVIKDGEKIDDFYD